MPIFLLRVFFHNVYILWRKIFPKEEKSPDDYLLMQIPREKARRESLIILSVTTLTYLLLIWFVGASDPSPNMRLTSALIAAAVLLPFYLMFCYGAYKSYRRTHIEVLSPEGERKKQEKEALEQARQQEIQQQDSELLFESPWYFRYPIAFIILALLLWFLDAWQGETNTMALWLIAGLWGFIAAVLMRELVIFGILAGLCVGIGYPLFKGIAALPVSVSIIIGACIIAGAVGRNRN